MIPTRPKDSKAADNPLAWAHQCHRLFRREKSILIKHLHRAQLMARAKKALQIFLRHMAMAGGHIHNQFGRGR
jgi:methylphosphotriester-DNA--protein-cysteine methyltransferase